MDSRKSKRKIGVWVSGAEIQTSAVDTRTAAWVSTAEKFSKIFLGETRNFSQKFRSENSRRLWLFPGPVRGFLRKTPGKSRENCWKILPLQILGFRALGKANLPGTLGPHCRDLVPTFRGGCFFLKSTVPAFSSFLIRGVSAPALYKNPAVTLAHSDANRPQVQTTLDTQTECRFLVTTARSA